MPGKWQGSDRRQRLPDNWPTLAREVHKRSGWQCEFKLPSGRRCPRRADGGVDHIQNDDNHDLKNLRDTCHHHHGKKSSQEGATAKAEIAELKRRPAEQHPIARRRR
jgi:hypothetical protein